MKKILKGTRTIYRCFRKENNQWKYIPTSVISQWEPDSRALAFFTEYLDFVMSGGILSDTTRIWMDSIEDQPTAAVRLYNENKPEVEKIVMKKVYNHIDYDGNRLLRYFPDDMIINIIRKTGDMDFYEQCLQDAVQKKYGQSFLSEHLIFRVPLGFVKERPSDSDIFEFICTIQGYTRATVQKREAELPGNVAKYINYIAMKTDRTPEEEEILERVRKIDKF